MVHCWSSSRQVFESLLDEMILIVGVVVVTHHSPPQLIKNDTHTGRMERWFPLTVAAEAEAATQTGSSTDPC